MNTYQTTRALKLPDANDHNMDMSNLLKMVDFHNTFNERTVFK